ncbi:P-loop containing nucleoside triphosphate hydrolase protein [Punctularia strigosozonata HHB-11173 SS5]|uniref:P-loop containing nucleoside triphosphate hydrolase protein n=1 Tax=Punctularia strigosozonata (strain HHB-11173) TaxID=741275 RepID=UPI00044185DD|nr:P-loop containing nucleoside triphosphate hydrolase protein [Punctularia strigosozonata HHB-11173 SS5]EIN08787.1 P-loop containing nucleoside triphosphate hydrolase protein [Punctularia strigosozonata HHB-11173 SS5]
MAGKSLTENELTALSRLQLGLSPTTLVPPAYLQELKLHILSCPDDINFRIETQPGVSSGILTCLEQGCENSTIQLAPLESGDGGATAGVGTLGAYRVHIASHPTHQRERQARVRAAGMGHAPLDSAASRPSGVETARRGHTPVFEEPKSNSASRVKPLGGSRTQNTGKTKAASRSSLPGRTPSFSASGNQNYGLGSQESQVHRGSTGRVFAQPSSTPTGAQTGASHNAHATGGSSLLAKLDLAINNLNGSQRKPSTARREAQSSPSRSVSHKRPRIEPALRSSSPPPSSSPLQQPVRMEITRHNAVASGSGRSSWPYASGSRPGTSSLAGALGAQPAFTPYGLNRVKKEESPPPSHLLWSSAGPRIENNSNGAVKKSDEDKPSSQLLAALDAKPRLPGLGLSAELPPVPRLASDVRMLDIGSDDSEFDDPHAGPMAFRPSAFAVHRSSESAIEQFILNAGNAEQFDGNESIDKALKKLGLNDQHELLPGMNIRLMPHQIIGVAWMLGKERIRDKGGILADEMGLGKTVQMIATLCINRSTDPKCKTTLVIAPLALLEQWVAEIDSKTNCGMKCLIYHGSRKVKTVRELEKYDVVLTTGQTMALEWPDYEAEQKAKEKKRKRNDFIEDDSESDSFCRDQRKTKKTEGPLVRMQWYRIVVDEAQTIRNRRTRVSRAVTSLQAERRWCLTGTPIINTLADAFGYLQFLRIRPWYDWSEFNSHVAILEKRNPTLASSRLQGIFRATLLRRTKTSMLDGKRLIELPPKEVLLERLEFSQEERDIYKFVESRSQAVFNRYLQAGTVLKNYAHVLVMLLRLRQVCSHPCLIAETSPAYVSSDNATSHLSAELARATTIMGANFVSRIQFKLKEAALRRIRLEKEESADATLEDEECPICMDVLSDAVVTGCGHVFCRPCVTEVLNNPLRGIADDPMNDRSEERPCPSCRAPIRSAEIFTREAFAPEEADLNLSDDEDPMDVDDDNMSDFIVPSDDDQDGDFRAGPPRRQSGAKSRARNIIHDSDSEEEEIAKVVHGSRKSMASNGKIKTMSRFLPSTKMKAMMANIKRCALEHPEEKTMVVSQWTSCLALVSDYLNQEGIKHVKYQGDMKIGDREASVRAFMTKDHVPIMLMSLKCGGVGLNLTRANRVISLDLGWSEAVEAQAFDRVHRLGQTRHVNIQRLVIKDTVEDRILALQERKRNLADGSLGEGTAKRIRLSVKELANLFGLDTRGRLLQ